MLRRALITGGTGFVGAHLVRHLREERVPIVVVASNNDISSFDTTAGFHKVDIRKESDVRSVMQLVRPTEIYHLAAISSIETSWRNPSATFEVNVIGTF